MGESKVEIYAPSATTDDDAMMLLQNIDREPDEESVNAASTVGNQTPLGAGAGATRRHSIISEVGELVAPLPDEDIIPAMHKHNEEQALSTMQRMKRFVFRRRSIFSLKLFQRGNKKIDSIYRRGSLPQDASCLVMDPKSDGLKRWDVYIMLLLLYTAIVTPYEVGFLESKWNAMFVINRMIDLSFMVDVYINFVTARFDDDNGRWRYKLGDIALVYLKSWFFIDLVSVLPFDILGVVMNNDAVSQLKVLRVVRLLRLLKLARILRASRIFRRWENQINLSYSVMSLTKFMVGVTVVAHWMGCVWRIVVDIEADLDNNWLRSYGVEDEPHGAQYIAALYWSVMTITTIGYGDVAPQTDGERFVGTMCMLIGASIYAYVVGAVCGIVSGLDEATSRFHNTMDQLNNYMEEYHLPKSLRITLREYFRHCRVLTRERYYHELLVQMSPALRGEVAVFCHSAWILKVPFFNSPTVTDEERERFIIRVAMDIEPQVFAPNEAIISVNQPANEMYLLQKGVVAKQGMVLGSGQFFGEDMILKKYSRPYSVRTLTYADVFVLTKESLNAIIGHNEFPATRHAIRRAAIALAFRNKFVTVSKTLSAFDLRALRRRSKSSLGSATPKRGNMTLLTPSHLRVDTETKKPMPSIADSPTLTSTATGADAGAGAGAGRATEPGLAPGAAVNAATTPSLPNSVRAQQQHASPAAMTGSGTYMQVGGGTSSSQRQLVTQIQQMIASRHSAMLDTLSLQFNKLSTRMDHLAAEVATMKDEHSKRGCCK